MCEQSARIADYPGATQEVEAMLERIGDLPPEIEGIRAIGNIAKEDYDIVMEPLLRDALLRPFEKLVVY